MVKPVERPLAPHLQVYRWGPHMLVSILHRATGDFMALLAAPLLVWWLYSISAGPESYADFITLMGSPVGLVVLIGISYAFLEHMLSGIRHFVLDTGAGYELETNKTWSVAVVVGAILLTALLWAVIFFVMG